MKYTNILVTLSLLSASGLHAGWMDTFTEGMNVLKENNIIKEDVLPTQNSSVKKTTSSTLSDLSTGDMNGALKEALSKGVSYAIDSLGQENGYLNNALTKIALPENLQKTASLVRKAGGDKYVDDLILAINNAATEAAPKTATIFANSISSMSIDDAKNILAGSESEATDYFRKTTTTDLQATIAPIIKKSMDNNEVAKYYALFQGFYKENAGLLQNEYVSGIANMFGYGDMLPSEKDEDINSFITNKSIDGIMVMIQEEEKKIRDNPLSQNSDLIGKVFSVFK